MEQGSGEVAGGTGEPVGAAAPVDPWAPPSAQPHAYPPAAPQQPYAGAAYPPPAGYGGWSLPPAAKPPVNGFALVSLITALTCFLWPLALAFGITGLVQIPRRRQRGTALAVCGMVLSLLGLFATIGVVVGVSRAGGSFSTAFAGGTVPEALQKGQCFNRNASRVNVVSCDGAHDGEVVGVTRLDDAAYPSQDRREREAGGTCQHLADVYALDNWALPGSVLVHYFYPRQIDWDAGERRVSCFLTEPDQKLTGSLRKDTTNTTPTQLTYLWAMDNIDTEAGERPTGSVSDDPASFRSWALSMATTLEAETKGLAGDTWDPAVKAAVDAQVAELKLRIPALRAAAASTTTNELTAQLAESDQHRAYDQQKAVRALLGLSTDEQWMDDPSPSAAAPQSV